LPTGQRIHHPLTVTKAKDVASSKLFAACCKGEQVDVEIDFYRIKPTGEEELYYKITVNDAVIVEMGENTPTTFLAENKPYHDMENVSFTYSKITWSYTDGNIEYTDDWKA
ncbi:MAG: type VI secretion system tube protein Hcp, partial [Succinivibrionaceae bacterium]|nr:type VI secretion system tube protein Hcp [Succinivibrionaceae bacterium]